MTGPAEADAASPPPHPAPCSERAGPGQPETPQHFRFSKAQRVTRKSEYDAILAQGEKAVTRHFVCYWTRQHGQGCKLGLIVSRKVGKAVVRNRVKRYLREFFRTHRHRMLDDCQLVIIARPACAALEFEQCAAAVRQLLEQRHVLGG